MGWKGFEHIKVLLGEEAQEIIAQASQLQAGDLQRLTDTQTNEETCQEREDKDGSFLWTAGCFIECLLFYGYAEAASELAIGCVEFLLAGPTDGINDSADGMSEPSEPDSLVQSIVRLHEEKAEMLWGGGCRGSLLVPLMVVYRALERRGGPWARRVCHISRIVPGLTFDGDDLAFTCSYVVAVGMVCCVLPDEGNSVTSQVSLVVVM